MRILLAMGVLSATARPGLTASACLQYTDVSLTGTVVRQTYAGPPDYESVTKDDEPQVIWVLLLDRYICVVDADSRLPTERYQNEVQLVLPSGPAPEELLGKRIVAAGRLVHGGARYDKRLVLMASEVKRTGVLP